ncbi:MAG TPA: hypothetical protein VFZ65_19640 [Planctomycetota bacterium]|nr:hypothetical protein [Planctomycetota bacterium]
MSALRWTLDWVAPLLLISVGLLWLAGRAGVLGGEQEPATLVFDSPPPA